MVNVFRTLLNCTGTGWKIAGWIVLCLVLRDAPLASAQPMRSGLYFANDRVRTAKLIERKEILNYRVALAGERRYRETYFDTPDLYLYHRGMFYRVRESFDGQGQIDFSDGRSGGNGAVAGRFYSVALPAAQVLAARTGRLNDAAVQKRLRVPEGPEFNVVQLVAEYSRHSVALERAGKQEFLVSLLVGSFEGFFGRKLRKEFWALEVEASPGRRSAAQQQEFKRVIEYLVAELRFNADARSLYTQGVEKAVLLRADERRIEAVNIVGGARGDFPEQFNEPDPVAFTLDGKLLAADTDNARFKIYRFDDKSHTVRIIGREGSRPGEFNHGVANTIGSFIVYHQVQGIAVDKNGLIYVIDQGNYRIQVFDAEGNVLPEKVIPLSYCPAAAPRCAEGLWRPVRKSEYTSLQGLAIDHEGGIFISDSGTSRIYRLLPGGRLDPGFKSPEPDAATNKPVLKEPESLALYRDKLFVANEGTGDIGILDRRSGKPLPPAHGFGADVFGGDVEGLAVLEDFLFAVDVQNTRIAVFDLKSETPKFLMGFVGDYESADGIAVDPTGKYVAIADQGNLRIVLYSLPEILSHLSRRSAKE
jgi:sugar lactone lactonase YvrE